LDGAVEGMSKIITSWTLIVACLALSPRLALPQSPDAGTDPRPNILLIVADDLGYADLGAYGSSIRTPNIDVLAQRGIRFSQFHTAPLCSPTRAMLMSGNNNHVAGVGRQHPLPPLKGDQAGYEGHLSNRVAPLPLVLKKAGYHTFMAGKWHLGTEEEHSPKAAGFERSFGVVEGAASHFDGRGFENAPTIYRDDGVLTEWPEGAYSTALYTDRLIGYIETHRADGKPFFAFAAYTSPHWPLQVPDEERDRYTGHYDAGYDVQRKRNFAALQAAGMISPAARLRPRNPEVRPWTELDEDERRREARKMELYAAMVENLDGHVGRLIAYLKNKGLYDNTLIVFMSDNGADGIDFYERGPYVDYIRSHYPNRFGDWGGPESWVSYDYPWAEASSAPFKLYKSYTSEGGIVAPLIIAGRGITTGDQISHSYLTVMDLAPTFIELASARYPDDGSVKPMLGESLLPVLNGRATEAHAENYVTVLEHRNNALLRQGRWKLTAVESPFEETGFALYDIVADPGETTDLSSQLPEKREELLEIWRQRRLELGIVLPQDL
jgi:arylsulfatase